MATAKVLIVGGGGGGGSRSAGGGGAGEYYYNATETIALDTIYSVVIGAGGAGGTGGSGTSACLGANGGNSTAFGKTALGGGGGGYLVFNPSVAGSDGGSGGGGSGNGNAGQSSVGGSSTASDGIGNDGGDGQDSSYTSGGGGGSAAAGANGSGGTGGAGGAGTSNSISGSALFYAAGGGGAGASAGGAGGSSIGGAGATSTAAGSDASPANRGSGGGGARNETDSSGLTGGDGSAGVVVISYVTADFPLCTGGTKTTDGTNTVHTFTTSGDFIVGGLAAGLVSYWKLDGNSTDSVGSNNGTDTNVTYDNAYGVINQGATFGTTDGDGINVGNDVAMRTTGDLSISLWFYLTSDAESSFFSGGGTAGSNYNNWVLWYYPTQGILWRIRDTADNLPVNIIYPFSTTGEWFHIVGKIEGTTATLYVNGVAVGTDTFSGTRVAQTDDNVIGGGYCDSGYRQMHGYIDEVGFWSRAISDNEVSQLFNAHRGLQYSFTGPVTHLLTSTGNASDLTSYTFSSVDLGLAATGRYIVVCATGRQIAGGACVVSTITIGGVSATIAEQVYNTGNATAIAIANVPTGSTGDVVVTFDTGMGNCEIGVYYSTRITSTTKTDSGDSTADPGTFDLDIAAGGVAFAIGTNDLTTSRATWTGLYATWNKDNTVSNAYSGAVGSFAAAQTNLTVSSDFSGSNVRPTFVTASFPYVSTGIKSINGLAYASIKSKNGLAIASVKSANGLE